MTASNKPVRSLCQQKPDSENQEKLILTAASQSFGPSLLALLGSLTLNWTEGDTIICQQPDGYYHNLYARGGNLPFYCTGGI
jgi:hypothetical protein